MKASTLGSLTLAVVMAAGTSIQAFAAPGDMRGGGGGGGGGGFHGGPGGFHEGSGGFDRGHGGWGRGPGRGHGLPEFARELWIAGAIYFFAAGTYYIWNTSLDQYVVVEPPPATAAAISYDVIAYPARGQTPDQQARDRYECHDWAVSQSGFDPARATAAPLPSTADYYRRALGACLSGRGYSIN